jgi:hypothetical protein
MKEGSYFAQTTSRVANPAEALSFRDGGVGPKDQVPEKIGLELFSSVPRREQIPQYSDHEKKLLVSGHAFRGSGKRGSGKTWVLIAF